MSGSVSASSQVQIVCHSIYSHSLPCSPALLAASYLLPSWLPDVNAICSPTRTSFMTAKYPIHVGLQHGVILDSVPNGVPVEEKLMPAFFREAGYATHMVGKVGKQQLGSAPDGHRRPCCALGDDALACLY
jgi:hypothetical protein